MNENILSERSRVTPPSFIRGILKATENEEMISFAGDYLIPFLFLKKP